MARHHLVYTHGGGRLGNQVLRFVHWIAWAQEHADLAVTDVAFWPHARGFARWRAHPGCTFPAASAGADRVAGVLAELPALCARPLQANNRWLRAVQALGDRWPGAQAVALDITREVSIDLDDPAFLARVRAAPFTFVCGWRIASWRAVAAREAALREWFQPAPGIAARAAEFVAGLRRRADVVIGVFIRQGDYRDWHGGRFHFAAERYAAWMRELLDWHAGRRVAFVIAADTAHDPAIFAGLPVHFASGSPNRGGDAMASWAELAECDAIVSVPSTFSATAAFAGGCPLWPLVDRDRALDPGAQAIASLAAAARDPVFGLAVK